MLEQKVRSDVTLIIKEALKSNKLFCLEEIRLKFAGLPEENIQEIEKMAEKNGLKIVHTLNEKENILEKEQEELDEDMLYQHTDFTDEKELSEISAQPLETEIELDESVKMFLNEISLFPLLSLSEERKLFIELAQDEKIKNDFFETISEKERAEIEKLLTENPLNAEEAKQKIINSNLKLVVSIAKKYTNVGNALTLMDLTQEGTLGLIRAIDKYRLIKGFKFSTYATFWIKQSVMRALGDQSRTIRIPIHMGEVFSKVRKELSLAFQEGRPEPSIKELSEKLNINVMKITEIMLHLHQEPVSLEKPVDDDNENDTVASFISDEGTFASPYAVTENNNLADILNEILDGLEYREAMVIRYRYGFCEGGIPKTLDEIGKIFNITRERVRQLEIKALRKLRHPSRRRKIDDFR